MSDTTSVQGHFRHQDEEYAHTELKRMLSDSHKGQKWWSFGNGSLTVIIVTFSAIAATLAQLKELNILGITATGANTASILSIIVTITSTVQTKMGFERKWAANRSTHSALSQLKLDEAAGIEDDDLREALKRIIATHDQTIIGAHT